MQLPWSAWHDESTFDLKLSDTFRIEVLSAARADAWSSERIRDAIENPIGIEPLRELSASCYSACIAVDDLARPTRASDLLPHVLRELKVGGIAPNRCTIVVATGTHGGMDWDSVIKKIGREAAHCGAKIVVHSPDRLVSTGITYGNDELLINSDFFEADLKIGVSCVLPHSFAGYSGGAKMMLPGLADRSATARSHKFVQMGLRSGKGLNDNRFRQEIESIALQLGFRFTVCVVCNSARETIGVVAGDLISAHRAACELAADRYRTPFEGEFDALILNAYPKDVDLIQSENAMIAFKESGVTPVKEGGVVVLCTAAKMLGTHGLFEPDGTSYREPGPIRKLANRELWILAPNLDKETVHQKFWTGYRFIASDSQLNEALNQRFGSGARIGVLPTAPMQQLISVDGS